MLDFEYGRELMVQRQIRRRGISDEHLIEAMRRVPRERFVSEGMEEFAYDDTALPIAEGQTISQPFVVALMVAGLELEPGDKALEVGVGSGYAAAVMSRIADRVFGIERHRPLAEGADAVLDALGYDNVRIRAGDGTRGWPEEAPFDAILVSAGGPSVPQALKQQLAIGGRLVVPVGEQHGDQRLMRIVRRDRETYEEKDLAAVRFVPLIGEDGWEDPDAPRPLPAAIAEHGEPLPSPNDPGFGAFFDRFGEKKVVLLGEASHGTSEFYRARSAITRRLIERHGFTIVAVEADWPDAAAIDRHVRLRPPREGEKPFRRFPTWMWRNTDVDAFVHWLREHNEKVGDENARAGFYGLDIYNMSASIGAVLAYLDDVDPEAAEVARQRYGCLTPWQKEPSTYGHAVLTSGYRKCEQAVIEQCRALLESAIEYGRDDSFLDAAQNARLVAAAEEYYRIMYYGGARSWNLRDRHMFETLDHVLEARGPEAKAVVWAHNSHIGDARETEMGWIRNELNLGQLCRERFGEEAALIGFGTNQGTVAAADDWDGAMKVMRVRPGRDDSFECLFHESGKPRLFLDMGRHPELADRLAETRLERFIGVIYRPETEFQSHYAEAALSRQFDAFVWFDDTSAVTPLKTSADKDVVPDTYPFGE
jgi:protein-L-isoaspartate(D-aspartate) O-methyltransferase